MMKSLLAVIALLAMWTPARAEEYTLVIRSLHPNAVQVQFYSQDRKGHTWPTSKTAWPLADDDAHALSIRCNANEKICWGAWVKGATKTEWGAGIGGTDGCKGCCFTCNNSRTNGVITLRRSAPTWDLVAQPHKPPKAVRID